MPKNVGSFFAMLLKESRLTLTCATDHVLETSCPQSYKVACTDYFGQVALAMDAQPGCTIHLSKFMVYHTSQDGVSRRNFVDAPNGLWIGS